MASETFESNRLRIHRLRVECLVSADHPSPERVSRHMAGVAESNLAHTLHSLLDHPGTASDSGLYFIKQLEIAVDVNVDWDFEQLARCVATGIARHLYEEIGGTDTTGNVVRFRNPAEYLTSFLNDLAQGHAWSKWYYHPFDGVRALPLSAALRTVLENHAAHALAALHMLDGQSLRRVLGSLTRGDCERTVESLAGEGHAGNQAAAYDAVEVALRHLPYDDIKRLSPEHGTLWLYIETTRRALSLSNRVVGEAAYAICRCVHHVDEASMGDRTRLLHALTTGNLTGIDASVLAGTADWLVPLLSQSEAWRTDLVDLLVHEGKPPAQGQRGAGEPTQHTPFGGVFYLLPLFAELPLDTQLSSKRDIDGGNIEAVLRLLLLAKVYGGQEARAVARDPVVQELCGIPPGAVSRSLFVEYQRRLTVPELEEMARQVIQRGFSIDQETKSVWALTRTVTTEGTVTALFDAERGMCLWAVRSNDRHADFIVKKVRQTLDEWSAGVDLMACDPFYYKDLKSTRWFDRLLDLSDSSEEISEARPLLRTITHYRNSLHEELDHLRLPPAFGVSRARDRTLSGLAQAYLRVFSSRFSGFSCSTIQYLVRNLLDCRATIEQESARHVVRVSHPPLHLLLNAIGLNRKQYTLPWVDSRPFLLFPEDV